MKYYLIFFKGGNEYGFEAAPDVCRGDVCGYAIYTDKKVAEHNLKWWNKHRGVWSGYYTLIEIDEKELEV